MDKNYKPDWNNAVSPYLSVDDVEKEIAFIQAVFSGELVEAPKSPDGKVFHAEIKIDDSVIMIGRASKEYPALKGNIHVYVRDVDAVYMRALKSGATKTIEPTDLFYGNREAGVVDPQGNQWWLAQLLKVMTENEITENHPR